MSLLREQHRDIQTTKNYDAVGLNFPSLHCQTTVHANPSALFDIRDAWAIGLPSMIQDGSIGLGFNFKLVLAVCMKSRFIFYMCLSVIK